MYLVVTHIPVYVDGERYLIDMSWQRDLMLARDWLAASFGGLKLLAPSLPISAVSSDVMQLTQVGRSDGIVVVPSFDLRCRARAFWLRHRMRWLADVRRELRGAAVVQTAAARDINRPLAFLAHREGMRCNVPTVLIGPDMDPNVLTVRRGLKWRLYCRVFDHFMKRAASTADLTLLKDGAVYQRYSRFSRNGKAVCHSMHTSRDVIDSTRLEERLRSLKAVRPLRAVYAGRFVARKGLHDALTAVAMARKLGAMVEFHLFGGGPEEEALRRQTARLGIEDIVHFRGVSEYGSAFLADLAAFDLLLFLPTEEDTPRMLYDAMAAGLPVLGSRIPFLASRVASDRMGVLVAIGDVAAAARELVALQSEPESMKILARASRTAGLRHSSEEWYRRRAAWTQEAVHRRHPSQQPPD